MAKLYIAEFNAEGGISNFPVFASAAPPVTEQVVAIGAGSVQSAAFNVGTDYIRLHTDTTCTVVFGDNPSAVAGTKMRFVADSTDFFVVKPGQKLAVIIG